MTPSNEFDSAPKGTLIGAHFLSFWAPPAFYRTGARVVKQKLWPDLPQGAVVPRVGWPGAGVACVPLSIDICFAGMAAVPLHTRSISLRIRWSRPGEIMAEGRLIDIRKRSIIPLGASLRGPGVVHDMSTRVWVDLAERRITRLDPGMDAFPYVPSPHTAGETCTARLGEVQALAGSRLDESYADVVTSLVGGPRGCFHIFTLLRLTGPAVLAAVGDPRLQDRLASDPPPAEGEVLWARSVSVDSFKGEGLSLRLHGTLTDTFQRGGPPENDGGSEELLSGIEVMADLGTGFPDLAVGEIGGRRRRLLPGFGRSDPWESVDSYPKLLGVNVSKGFTGRVQQALGDERGLLPESHLVFMMAPVVMQSLPGMLEEMDIRPGTDGRGSSRSALNSCHMWRSDGPLDQLTQAVRARRQHGGA